MNKKSVYWGIFLIALTTLAWEILLTRIFSATMYYHFVFMSISLAMLGFGCSGVIVFLFPRFFSEEKSSNQLTLCSALFSVTIVLSVVMYLRMDSVLNPSLATFFALFKILFLIFLPYFFSGLTITLALKHYSKNVSVLYCYDLVGAGLGCIFIIGMLFIYDGISLVLLISGLAALSSVIFSQASSAQLLKKISFTLTLLALGAFICNAYMYQFLKIEYVSGKPQNGIIYEKWNPINRVTVTPKTLFNNDVRIVQYDSIATAVMHSYEGDPKEVDYLKNFIQSFLYQIRKNAEVLIIGIGGGQDVLNAYVNGSKSITAIEINPTIAQLNKETYRDFNGNLFNQPGVELIVDEGRNFTRHTKERYDIIHLPNVDSGVASSSGAFTFVENSLYTVEAFKDYYQRLKDDGILWVARWRASQKEYFLENFRILTGVLKALEELNVEHPEKHIVMLEEEDKPAWRQAIFLVKKTPFSPEEVREIDTLREKMELLWLHHPEKRMDNALDDYLFSSERERLVARYPFRIDPPTDNCPFFFNFLKPVHYIWRLPEIATHFTYPVFMFKSLFVIVLVMVIVAIFLPLLVFKRYSLHTNHTSSTGGYLVYFACLGLGFMLVEIPLIQKFILFLGQPLYAIAVILSTLLIFSGIGSMLAGGFTQRVLLPRLLTIIVVLCGLLVCSIYGLPIAFDTFLGRSGLARLIISVLLIMPLGILMGMTFPLGIRLLEQDGKAMIPWVWGINGACSVMGSIIAWGLSLNFGYNLTLWTATAAYGFACCAMAFKHYTANRNLSESSLTN